MPMSDINFDKYPCCMSLKLLHKDQERTYKHVVTMKLITFSLFQFHMFENNYWEFF